MWIQQDLWFEQERVRVLWPLASVQRALSLFTLRAGSIFSPILILVHTIAWIHIHWQDIWSYFSTSSYNLINPFILIWVMACGPLVTSGKPHFLWLASESSFPSQSSYLCPEVLPYPFPLCYKLFSSLLNQSEEAVEEGQRHTFIQCTKRLSQQLRAVLHVLWQVRKLGDGLELGEAECLAVLPRS